MDRQVDRGRWKVWGGVRVLAWSRDLGETKGHSSMGQRKLGAPGESLNRNRPAWLERREQEMGDGLTST